MRPSSNLDPHATRRPRRRHRRQAGARRWAPRAAVVVALALVAVPLGVTVPSAQAAFPGLDGKIAFAGHRHGTIGVFVMDPDGSAPQRLTDADRTDPSPTWSPDGSRIAFARWDGNDNEIHVMDADGGNEQRLTDNDAFDGAPSWSPDGSRIVFTSGRGDGTAVYTMDASGGDVQRLTGDGIAGSPAWSPDGSQIAFTRVEDEIFPNPNFEIYLMDVDGGDVQRLTDEAGLDADPAWSPDGARIAFTSTRDGNAEVYVMAADGSDPRRLTDDDAIDNEPAWSPEGSRIAFTSTRDGTHGVYVMGADGGVPQRISAGGADDRHPDWQPVAPAEVATSLAADEASYGFLLRSVTVHARLTVADSGAPIPGQRIVFSTGPRQLCVAHTDSTGGATCTAGLGGALAALLRGTYQASFAGDDPYLPVTATAPS